MEQSLGLTFADQQRMIHKFLLELMEIDSKRRIFTILIYAPPNVKPISLSPTLVEDRNRPRINIFHGAVDFGDLIDREWLAEAGNMAVSCRIITDI